MLSTSFFKQICNCNVQTVLRQTHMLLFCLDPYASLCSASAVWLLLLLVICLSKTQSAIPWWIITSPVEYHIPGGESHPQWSITSLVEYHIPMYMLSAAKSLSASIPRTLSIAYRSSAIHVNNPKPNPMMNLNPCLGIQSSNRRLLTN